MVADTFARMISRRESTPGWTAARAAQTGTTLQPGASEIGRARC